MSSEFAAILARFQTWMEEAVAHPHIKEPTAMTLATVDAKKRPSARIVLLKTYDERGFTFYTNLQSRKSEELLQNPHAALLFHWMPLMRQIRIEGVAEPVGTPEADAYFAGRPRESRIGAWASEQSRTLSSRELLEKRVSEFTQKFEGEDVPRPPHWSGWRVAPHYIEFWSEGTHRLHEREVFTLKGDRWEAGRLYP